MKTKPTPILTNQNKKLLLYYSSEKLAIFLPLTIFLLTFISSTCLFSQTAVQRQQIISKTNVAALQQMSIAFGNYTFQRRSLAEQWAIANGFPISGITPDGVEFFIVDFDSIRGPEYIATNNINSASTISTNKVLVGGVSGLNLSGSGITMAMWDGGEVCNQHPELIGRATQGTHESPVGFSSAHATHVAGTLIASGINPNSRGMAPSADVNYYQIGSWASGVYFVHITNNSTNETITKKLIINK